MKGSELFDKEKVHFNLARLTKGGEHFEVIIEPDAAVAFKNGSLKDIKAALKYEKVFSDAKKGLLAPETSMQKNFNTSDPDAVAEIIISKGDIQLTSAYRDSLQDAKRRQLEAQFLAMEKALAVLQGQQNALGTLAQLAGSLTS